MLLAIDIGNTHIVLGLYQGEKLLSHWRISSSIPRTEDEYWVLIKTLCQGWDLDVKAIKGVIISSVVPNLATIFDKISREFLDIDPVVVDHTLDLGIKILYKDPGAVGADRICNAVAGFEKYGGPLIIVDFGTATTLDVISAKGEYLGGIIAPGVETSASELFKRAAKLPRVELKFPGELIGRDTESAMQSGIMYGAVEQVDGLVGRIKQEIGQAEVVATGGLASLVVEKSKTIDKVEPFLTLEGLKIIYNRVERKV